MRVALDARKAYDTGIGRYIRGLTTTMVEVDPALELSLLQAILYWVRGRGWRPPGLPDEPTSS